MFSKLSTTSIRLDSLKNMVYLVYLVFWFILFILFFWFILFFGLYVFLFWDLFDAGILKESLRNSIGIL